MIRTALLALALALGGGAFQLGLFPDGVPAAKAGSHFDPNGLAATGDAGSHADPNGAAANRDAGTNLDPNG